MARPKKDNSKSPFPKLLKALLAERRVSQRQAAKAAGVSPATINGWISGVSPEDYLSVQRLAEFLGTTMSYLLTGKNEAYRLDQQPTLTELFSEGIKVSGIYRIQVTQLVPRSGESDDENDK